MDKVMAKLEEMERRLDELLGHPKEE